MIHSRLALLTVVLSLALSTTIVCAHIPVVPDDGQTLETATTINEHWKSWFYYSELQPGEFHYYKFEATEGERLRFIITLPIIEGDRGFTPTFILMGGGIDNVGDEPDNLEVPTDAGVMVLATDELVSEYEGFTPLAQYEAVGVNMTAPSTGTYYIAVHDDSVGGRYALVTGYVEAYTVVEWMMVPFMVITILTWTGQNIVLMLAPIVLTVLVGLFLLWKRTPELFSKEKAMYLVGSTAALLMIGSGVFTTYQMVIALLQAPPNWTVYLTPVFAGLQVLVGLGVFRIMSKRDMSSKTSPGMLLVLGVIALFVWAGLVVGPAMILIVGLVSLVRPESV